MAIEMRIVIETANALQAVINPLLDVIDIGNGKIIEIQGHLEGN